MVQGSFANTVYRMDIFQFNKILIFTCKKAMLNKILFKIAMTFLQGTKTLADYKYSFTQKRSSK
jgi:hypothetical protein